MYLKRFLDSIEVFILEVLGGTASFIIQYKYLVLQYKGSIILGFVVKRLDRISTYYCTYYCLL